MTGRGYDGLVDVRFDKHLRTNHRQALTQDGVHINGIEFFWSFTKRRLAKFDSIKINFDIHLKESEWYWRKKDFDNIMTQIKQMMIYNLIFNIKSWLSWFFRVHWHKAAIAGISKNGIGARSLVGICQAILLVCKASKLTFCNILLSSNVVYWKLKVI